MTQPAGACVHFFEVVNVETAAESCLHRGNELEKLAKHVEAILKLHSSKLLNIMGIVGILQISNFALHQVIIENFTLEKF